MSPPVPERQQAGRVDVGNGSFLAIVCLPQLHYLRA